MIKAIIRGATLAVFGILSNTAVHADTTPDNEYNCFALTPSPQAPQGVEVTYEKMLAASAQGAEVKMARKYLHAETIRCF
ncbi:hypothetical protein HX870_23170 [Pseudomonas gingeri]|uniref:Uncharacterized protein n=1 Tax=Pseudomonas gingeri TaxID=117681 RepID=A0A7Y7XDQ2_9PSED|nr:hypothetical protein [Pseudomonas gingeri]NWA26693.1 hypothetical protein [Pseudomonas gingeri]NWB97779.1 hypothetical protein [Pseudomonas gingeri]NWD70505.1 hypothetical protein [Pseudomonas gingeri]NWD75592.1 hypothetical protein [Pseudomonas gingeri]